MTAYYHKQLKDGTTMNANVAREIVSNSDEEQRAIEISNSIITDALKVIKANAEMGRTSCQYAFWDKYNNPSGEAHFSAIVWHFENGFSSMGFTWSSAVGSEYATYTIEWERDGFS